MQIKLFREWIDVSLGHKPNWSHLGIRDSSIVGVAERHSDCFESALDFYGHQYCFVDQVEQADAVVFNLDRHDYYTNLNPILLLGNQHLKKLKKLNTPVIFWHSGECHFTMSDSWFTFAQQYLGRKIWYVDSNLNTQTENHLFFDDSDLLFNSTFKYRRDYSGKVDFIYDFCFVAGRSDGHKHIVYNHLKKKSNTNFLHFLNSTDLDNRYDLVLTDFDKATPPSSLKIPYENIVEAVHLSSVILSLNSYFIGNFVNQPRFDPLYITEKFRSDLSSNKPVLPVGHAGTVQYCRDQGFEFPDWIDYSYDQERDHDRRMQMILNEIDRLSDITNLRELAQKFYAQAQNRLLARQLLCQPMFETILDRIFLKNSG
jgi:hypothetical protein